MSSNLDETSQVAIQQLFLGCAPERYTELQELWNILNPKILFVDDIHEGDRFILDAGAYRYVRFNHRAVRAFWLGAFAAWEGYRTMCSSPMDFSKMNVLITAFEQVLISDDLDLEVMPEGIPEPGQLPDPKIDTQGRAAAELAIIATGWALLHEVRHLQHQQNGTGADTYEGTQKDFHEEELSCDVFATKFLQEKVADYSNQSSEELSKVKLKRQLGIYFSLFIITLLAKDKWGATKSHPSVQDRIDSVLLALGTDKSDDALFIAKKSFEALRKIWPAAPTV